MMSGKKQNKGESNERCGTSRTGENTARVVKRGRENVVYEK